MNHLFETRTIDTLFGSLIVRIWEDGRVAYWSDEHMAWMPTWAKTR